MTPHCCVHSPAAQAIQVGIVRPSTVQSRPGPYHFHLFLHLATFLALQNFMDGKELKSMVENWLNTQVAAFYDEEIQKLVPCYDKCLNSGSECRKIM